eukprot:scaffold1220_cov259-Pinguiococcus_pyrenoidosus.AAC.155
MRRGHLDDEGEHVVDERVESFVHEDFPRQLREHPREAEEVDGRCSRANAPRIPAAVPLVKERVQGDATDRGCHDGRKVPQRNSIVLDSGILLRSALPPLIRGAALRRMGRPPPGAPPGEVNLTELPGIGRQAEKDREKNHVRRVGAIRQVEEDHCRTK